MTEAEAVEKTKGMPATVDSIADDLSRLGVCSGMTLLVHSSLSSLGWVCGGPVAVVLALEKVLGPEGTLAMPTHSSDLSDPSRWRHPPIPEPWWEVVRREMPAYDVDMTPTRGMGAIVECFRRQKGTLRSDHPSISFAARGPLAKVLTENTGLDFPTGDDSFLGRLYDVDGHVLFLGIDFRHATSLHLAEFRAEYPGRKVVKCSAPVVVAGERRWVEFEDIDYDDSDFVEIGSQFIRENGTVRAGKVGSGTAMLMTQRSLVDFARRRMEQNRGRRSDVCE
jgi:aminoglycoside 3-N-acetyltransferase